MSHPSSQASLIPILMKVFVILQVRSVIVNPLILNPTFAKGAPHFARLPKREKKNQEMGVFGFPQSRMSKLYFYSCLS